jgi:iron complex transport system ATP-binding protein
MGLELDQVTVEIAGRRLIDRLDLQVRTGEVVGVVGPNGSGKSTALRCIYRALTPVGGTIRLDGRELSALSIRETAREVAALTQQGGSDFDYTVAEIVALGRTPHKRGNDPLTDAEQRICRLAMEETDIIDLADRGILGLSGGERQRVLVARALVQEPSFLILDEPTNHLDIRHQTRLLGALRRLAPTVIVVLHDLNLAASACDRIAVLDGGALVTVGTPHQVLTPHIIASVFGVDADIVEHPLTGDPQILFTLGAPHAPTSY